MIFPVAETLKVFFALEWVLTFGIAFLLHITLLVAPHRRNAFGTVWVNWAAKVGLLGENTKLQGECSGEVSRSLTTTPKHFPYFIPCHTLFSLTPSG